MTPFFHTPHGIYWQILSSTWKTHSDPSPTRPALSPLKLMVYFQQSSQKPLFCLNYYFFGPRCLACGILVPRLGIKPVLPAVEVQSPNHWTPREFPPEASFYASDHATPLVQNLPMDSQETLKTLQWPTYDLNLSSLFTSTPVKLVSLLFPEHAKHTLVLGPLHLSFSLLGRFFTYVNGSHFLQISAQMSPQLGVPWVFF